VGDHVGIPAAVRFIFVSLSTVFCSSMSLLFSISHFYFMTSSFQRVTHYLAGA
jgi:hypothetical protein